MTAQALATLLLEEKITIEKMESFLVSRNLTYLLPEVLRELRTRRDEMLRKDEVIIETPFELDKEALSSVKELVGAKDGDRERIIENKALLMGFRAEYKGMLYDASAQRIIRELTK